MKFLFLILIFAINCTKKEDFSQLQTSTITPIIIEETKTELVASYDKGLDLILIGSDFKLWYGEQQKIKEGYYSNMIEEPRAYSTSYYWNANDNTYYGTEMEQTNNILYTIDSNLQYEASYDSNFTEKYVDVYSTNTLTQSELLYVGSLDPLTRIYYDPTNNIQYIKKLKPISTDFYRDYDTIKKTSLLTNMILYPADTYMIGTELTNKNKQTFFIGTSFGMELVIDNN